MWCWRFQFVAIRLTVWTWIANTELILNANAEPIVFEWNQIAHFTRTTAYASAYRLPIAFGQFEHLHLIGDGEAWRHRNRWPPTQCETTIGHSCDDWTIGQWCWGTGALVFVIVAVQIADGCFIPWLECCGNVSIIIIIRI